MRGVIAVGIVEGDEGLVLDRGKDRGGLGLGLVDGGGGGFDIGGVGRSVLRSSRDSSAAISFSQWRPLSGSSQAWGSVP